MRQTEIDLLGREWIVKIVPSNDPGLFVDSAARVGTTWPVQRIIYISADIDRTTAEDVIAHEITHAIISSTEIDTPKEYDEEIICRFVENWHRMIPEMVKYISLMLLREELEEDNDHD